MVVITSQRLWSPLSALVRLDTAALIVITVALLVALAGR
jgi:hypothetical protein